MGRICTYPGCISGSATENNLAKRGIKKCRLFFVPKNPHRRQQWQRALQRSEPFADKAVICEKHFTLDDILYQDKILLKDGSTFISNRHKVCLSSTAIPQLYHQDTSKESTAMLDDANAKHENHSITDYIESETAEINPNPRTIIHEWNILKEIGNIMLPAKWTYICDNNNVIIGIWKLDGSSAKCFVLQSNSIVQVFINNKKVNIPQITSVNSSEDLLRNIKILESLVLCHGKVTEQESSKQCLGFVDVNKTKSRNKEYWCVHCRTIRYNKMRRKTVQKYQRNQKIVKIERQRRRRMQLKNEKLENEIGKLRAECSVMHEKLLNEKIETLPPEQQENVRACFKAAACSKKGIRYTKQWIYECLLMRIKNRKLYDHLRSHNILALPHVDTLHKYIQNTHNAYGFSDATFQCLKEKSNQLSIAERRGSLLIDEMKLMEGFRFNRDTCQFQGFVDLDKYTPEHQTNASKDHALVFMFQPFQGKWVQALACFLSKGCAASNVLTCLILECITYLENAGFFCDVVTTDGAQWNQSMWTNFGITEENISCQHPCDPERRLWFCSDFPHLIKNFRNCIVGHDEIWTPDGIIRKKHWKALLELKHVIPCALKISYKLSPDHLAPKYYQKMNVALAFQLFSLRLATAMTLLQSEHPDLIDCESTAKFISRVDSLISIMTSRTSSRGLRPNSAEYENIKQFIQFLNEWETEAKKMNYIYFAHNTSLRLKITLRATLEILDFLSFQCNYEYLMTARINQDALERFFSLARGVCGSNDHPDAILFGHMFRLMSTYSLIKPCKGSNVTGAEMLSALLTVDNISKETTDKEEYIRILDSIIENGEFSNNSIKNNNNVYITETSKDARKLQETNSMQYVIAYMTGYIVHKAQKWTSCKTCLKSLESPYDADIETNQMIKMLTIKSLKYPLQSLRNMLTEIEKIILTIVHDECFLADTFFHVCYALQEVKLPLVGCCAHNEELTKRLLNFYLIMRANFMSKTHNLSRVQLKEKTEKKARKDAKL